VFKQQNPFKWQKNYFGFILVKYALSRKYTASYL